MHFTSLYATAKLLIKYLASVTKSDLFHGILCIPVTPHRIVTEPSVSTEMVTYLTFVHVFGAIGANPTSFYTATSDTICHVLK